MWEKRLSYKITFLNRIAKGLLKKVDSTDIERLRELIKNDGRCVYFPIRYSCEDCKLGKIFKKSCYSQDAKYIAKRFFKLLDKELDKILLEGK